jgi:2'-hydroxyisoflavone reductase
MRILILGGTVFLGRHLVEAARSRGHDVTLFNRGQSNADLFPDVAQVHGDRKTQEGLAALNALTGSFDAVIDTCGYVPRVVRLSAQKLAERASTYCFISSVSVYKDWPAEPCDETGALATIDDPTIEEVTGETYGALKVLCEQEAEAAFPGRALIIRPGLIIGPNDPTDRFAYWPHRVAQGGEILAPGTENTPVQFIDVRDLAEWNIRLLESGTTGIYNADGPQMPIKTLLDTCGAEQVTYVSEAFLEEQGVEAWSQLPLWIPGLADKPAGGATDCRKALSAGLTYRPLTETVQATLTWDSARPQENAWKRTLTREREAEVLRAWHAAS